MPRRLAHHHLEPERGGGPRDGAGVGERPGRLPGDEEQPGADGGGTVAVAETDGRVPGQAVGSSGEEGEVGHGVLPGSPRGVHAHLLVELEA